MQWSYSSISHSARAIAVCPNAVPASARAAANRAARTSRLTRAGRTGLVAAIVVMGDAFRVVALGRVALGGPLTQVGARTPGTGDTFEKLIWSTPFVTWVRQVFVPKPIHHEAAVWRQVIQQNPQG